MSRKPKDIQAAEPRLRLPLLSDLAITTDECDADAFELENKLGAIVDAIFLKETPTPFATMLSGGWGSGKSSAMTWLDATLKKGPVGYGDADTVKVDTCWFYPWKYQTREDVWRGLVAEVILAAIKAESVDAAKIVKAARQFGAFLGRGFVRVLSAVSLTVGDAATTGASADIDLKEALGGVIEEYGKHVTPHEAYYNEFEDVLRRWVEDTYPVSGNRRLVVFIDDLDRCMPAIALQVLEALKLYLNVRNLVFIVGVDRVVIDRIVQKSYTDLVGKQAMDDGFSEKAARYLDKMFPVEINIEPTDEEVRAFFAKRIELTNVWQSIPRQHRELFKNVLLDIGGRTPRTIVRLVNRVVVAYGRRSAEGTTTLEQELQRELLDVVCQGLGYEDLPQRSANGRRFFATWSQILADNPGIAINIPQLEVEARLAKRDSTEIEQEAEFGWAAKTGLRRGRVVKGDAASREPRSEFSHLSRLLSADFSPYRELVSNLQVARLLSIPYRWSSEALDVSTFGTPQASMTPELWDQLRVLVARSMGVDPATLTSEKLRELDELELAGYDSGDLSPLAGLAALKRLDLELGHVSNVTPLATLTTLESLDLAHTRVSDISPLLKLTKLVSLSLYETRVSDLAPLTGLTALQWLNLWGTQVSNLSPLSGLAALQSLDLWGTQVSDLSPLAGLLALQTLNLSRTPVSDVSPLSGLTALQELYLSDTPVSDVSPVSGLIALRTLYLSSTQVSDVSPLSGLIALRTLYLSSTPVSDISPLIGLPNLTEVWLPDGTSWNPQTQPPPKRYMS